MTLNQFSLFTIELSVRHIDLLSDCYVNLLTLLEAESPFITKDFRGIRQVSS